MTPSPIPAEVIEWIAKEAHLENWVEGYASDEARDIVVAVLTAANWQGLVEALGILRPFIETEAKTEKRPWAIIGLMHIDAALAKAKGGKG